MINCEMTAARLILSFFPAPIFWLVKVSVPCENPFIDVYTKPSMLIPAEFPAMTVLPKVFIEDWIITFEKENIIP